MIKSDVIIAVKDVERSSKFYQKVFNCRSIHGGDEFAVLVDGEEEVVLCLHKWGEHEHPTMMDQKIVAGNGLIIYFRTNDMEKFRLNLEASAIPVEKDIHVNPNTRKKEFSLRDPDGYYLTVTEFHTYKG